MLYDIRVIKLFWDYLRTHGVCHSNRIETSEIDHVYMKTRIMIKLEHLINEEETECVLQCLKKCSPNVQKLT